MSITSNCTISIFNQASLGSDASVAAKPSTARTEAVAAKAIGNLTDQIQGISSQLAFSGFSPNAIRELKIWMQEPNAGNRLEALSRILECKENNAQELDLRNLGLTRLPNCMEELGKITQIRLDGNRISDIDSLLALDKNCVVYLLGNPLRAEWEDQYDYHAHPIIYDDASLQELQDWANDEESAGEYRKYAAKQLKECYETRCPVLNLEELKLGSLPKFILRCKSISILDASDNALSSLPDGFFNSLDKLRFLNVPDNCFRTFPWDIPENIEKIDLTDNRKLFLTGKMYLNSRLEYSNLLKELYGSRFENPFFPSDDDTNNYTPLEFWNYEFVLYDWNHEKCLYDPIKEIDSLEALIIGDSFANFLIQLAYTEEYKKNRGDMIVRVHRILNSAVENESFLNEAMRIALEEKPPIEKFKKIEASWKRMRELEIDAQKHQPKKYCARKTPLQNNDFKDMSYDLLGRMGMDRSLHEEGPNAFESNEPGYREGMKNGWQYAESIRNYRMHARLFSELHDVFVKDVKRLYETSAGPTFKTGFSRGWHYDIPCDSVTSWEKMKSEWESEKLLKFVDSTGNNYLATSYITEDDYIRIFSNFKPGDESRIDKIFDKFYAEIKTAESMDDKYAAVARCCRSLLVFHAFPDGNGRAVSFALLTILLYQIGSPPAMLNPTHPFDGSKTVNEMVIILKEGIDYFQRMRILTKIGEFTGHTPTETDAADYKKLARFYAIFGKAILPKNQPMPIPFTNQ